MKHLLSMAAVILGLGAPASASSWFSSSHEREPLYLAHEAYLQKDLRQMALELKRVFEDKDTDETTHKNALALLEKAYETGHGSIDADWSLPTEVSKMKVSQRRVRKPNRDTYTLKISGDCASQGIIRQLKLTHYPDRVVLDKQGKVGDWVETQESDGLYYELDGPSDSSPASEGLYLIHLELANGAVTQGWFILSNLVSSETPVVRTPYAGQIFTTRNPTMKWDNFISPEYKSFEGRSLWMAAVRSEPPLYEWKEVWTRWEDSPGTIEATLGVDGEGRGVKRLEDGRYVFYVSYKETRHFGDLRLSRTADTQVAFHIKGK